MSKKACNKMRGNNGRNWAFTGLGLIVGLSLALSYNNLKNDVFLPDSKDAVHRQEDRNLVSDLKNETRSDQSNGSPRGHRRTGSKRKKRPLNVSAVDEPSTNKEDIQQEFQNIQQTNLSLSPLADFSACLLLKDDNAILSEWIAYHYHALKMRHLVVAVDPLSTESPHDILSRWDTLTDLQVFEWEDSIFMPREFIQSGQIPVNVRSKAKLEKDKPPDEMEQILRHRYRQRVFYAKCLRFFRDNGSSWVIHTDSDEYAVVNKQLRNQKEKLNISIPPMDEPGSILSFLQQFVTTRYEDTRYPCIPTPRILFGSDESSLAERSYQVPVGFNGTSFETLRWRYHAPLQLTKVNGHPKDILDVTAIPESLFPDSMVDSIHRPIKDLCPSPASFLSNARSRPITLNHYLGSLEKYNAREDSRRNQEKYGLKASAVSEKRKLDDGLRAWLAGFVHSVGQDLATQLLGGGHFL